MTLRVIQWATGPVGMAQLREMVARGSIALASITAAAMWRRGHFSENVMRRNGNGARWRACGLGSGLNLRRGTGE
jgi:hypothetical protein